MWLGHIRNLFSRAAKPASSKAQVTALTSPARETQVTEQCIVPVTGFASLVPEIQQQIMEHCESGDLLRLAQTSRGMSGQVLPMLYRHVDLSCHRDMGRFVCYRDIYLIDIPPPKKSDDLFSKLHRRQDLFFDAILTTPSRGELVLSLTWTYEWCDVHPRETGDRALRMGRAFVLLSRIRKLDMCFFNRESSHICRAPSAPLRDLISGMDSAWDRVRGRTRTPDELFIITIHPREILMSLDWFSTLVGHVDQRSAEVLFCKQLFSSTHTLNTALHYNVGVMSRWDREVRRYAGIAHFINSLRPTLTTLVLEHGIHVQSGQPVSLSHGSWMRVGRPKNAFLLSVLPVLAEGPWPQLKTLSVRGLGPWLREQTQDGIHEHPYEYEDSETLSDLEAAKDQVRAALGDDIRLYWEMATGRSLYPTLGTYYQQ